VITTIAGTGAAGYSGDMEQAGVATLNSPHGVAADAEGDIYIADTGNRAVRRIDSAGVITTIAGGSIQNNSPGSPALPMVSPSDSPWMLQALCTWRTMAPTASTPLARTECLAPLPATDRRDSSATGAQQ